MPAKKKKTKAEEASEEKEAVEKTEKTEEQPEAEIIEVRTSKKPKKEKDEAPVSEETSTELMGGEAPKVTSFAQLDADKPAAEEVEEKIETPEKPKEEKAKDISKEEKKIKISSEEVKKWISDVPPETLEEESRGRRLNWKSLLVILVIAAISGIIVGGIIYFNSRVSKAPPAEETIKQPTPTPQEKAVEEKMAEEEINLGEFSARVLNGAGIPGEAAKVKSMLVDIGLEEIDTGNADSYDYKETEVSLKEGVPEGVYSKIVEALSGEYNVVKSETPLSEDSEYDAEVIVGSRK